MNITAQELRHLASEPRPFRLVQSAMNDAADKIDQLESTVRMLIDNIESGSYESTGMAVDQVKAQLIGGGQ